MLELGQVGGPPGLADPGEVVGALGHDGPGAGVLEDPADLLGRRGLVDRHGDGAGEPDRVVEQGPLVAGLRQQGDAVAGLDAGRDQTLGDGTDLVVELGGGDVDPARAGVRLKTAVSAASRALVTTSSVRFPVVGMEMRERRWRTRARWNLLGVVDCGEEAIVRGRRPNTPGAAGSGGPG